MSHQQRRKPRQKDGPPLWSGPRRSHPAKVADQSTTRAKKASKKPPKGGWAENIAARSTDPRNRADAAASEAVRNLKEADSRFLAPATRLGRKGRKKSSRGGVPNPVFRVNPKSGISLVRISMFYCLYVLSVCIVCICFATRDIATGIYAKQGDFV